jgi:hypothetical protein
MLRFSSKEKTVSVQVSQKQTTNREDEISGLICPIPSSVNAGIFSKYNNYSCHFFAQTCTDVIHSSDPSLEQFLSHVSPAKISIEHIDMLNVKQLKDELRKHGQNTTGLKEGDHGCG